MDFFRRLAQSHDERKHACKVALAALGDPEAYKEIKKKDDMMARKYKRTFDEHINTIQDQYIGTKQVDVYRLNADTIKALQEYALTGELDAKEAAKLIHAIGFYHNAGGVIENMERMLEISTGDVSKSSVPLDDMIFKATPIDEARQERTHILTHFLGDIAAALDPLVPLIAPHMNELTHHRK